MDRTHWEDELITLFCYLAEAYHTHLWMQVERLSPNNEPRFSDEEVLTLYFFGLYRQLRTLHAIHSYTRMHLRDWFPQLPGYGGFVQRLNRLADLFPALLERILTQLGERVPRCTSYVVDSLPIILAGQARSGRARVAREHAAKGYCASKRMYFYGLKVHVLGLCRAGTLPLPEQIRATAASENDLTVLKCNEALLPPGEIFADKLFWDRLWQAELRQHQVQLHTPIKRAKGQKKLDAADRLYSAAVSRVRQAIESLFNWIEQKTGIQQACRVRSSEGLWVHVFGRFAAAMLLLLLNP